MNKFSIIIPTMWLSSKVIEILRVFNSSDFVDEIILIDNNFNKAYNLNEYKKVIHIKNENNLYVNPSWNLGVKLSKNENVIISNDDLIIKNIDSIISNSATNCYDLIGLDYQNINKGNGVIFKNSNVNMEKGFGCFMITKKSKYINIPEEIKIWYGDLFLFNSIKNKAIFSCDGVDIQLSRTVLKIQDLHSIIDNDKKIFSKIKF